MTKIRSDDEGELNIAISEKDGVIIIDFGKKVSWIGLTRQQAQTFALDILRRSVDRYVSMRLPDPTEDAKR
jgi:hypothetical protein